MACTERALLCIHLQRLASYTWPSSYNTFGLYYIHAGPSEAGQLGRPEPPHFSWKNLSLQQEFIVYSRVPRLTTTTPHYYHDDYAARGRESVHVVNINHVLPSGSWIVCVLFYL